MPSEETTMRVVHLVTSLEIGGLERVVLDLVRHSDRHAFEPHVVALGRPGALAPEFEALGVAVESLGWTGRRQDRPRAAWRLSRLLSRLGAHVLHTHNPEPHYVGALAALLGRVPVLVHTKHGRNYPDRPRSVRLNRLASRSSSRIVAVSHDAADVACRIERVPAGKVCVIHNGVDPEQHAEPHPRTFGPIRRAVHVGRLNWIKDQATLLRAVRLVCDRVPDFELDVVGDGEERAGLERLRAELRLEDRVRFLGFRHDVARALAEADLFVLSSLSEGVSITLLEAMAAGLPVVATRVGGTPEVVVDGATGRLVPPGSPEALAAALLGMVQAPESAWRLGTAGRRRAVECFDVRAVARRYEGLYVDCVRGVPRYGRRRQARCGPATTPQGATGGAALRG